MQGRIDRNLNLVLPVERDDGSTAIVHSTPISRDIFELYYRPIARVLSDMANDGLAHLGPRLGLLQIERSAKALGEWEGENGVEQGLLGEIRRLTSVIVPKPEGGWQAVPFETASNQSLLSDEDQREVLAAVVFFICNSAIVPRKALKDVLNFAFLPFGAAFTSQTATAYAASSEISKLAGNSGDETLPTPEPEAAPATVARPSSVPA